MDRCTEKFDRLTAHYAIALAGILAFTVIFSCPVQAADLFVEGGAGVAQSLKTNDDGVWIQDLDGDGLSWWDRGQVE